MLFVCLSLTGCSIKKNTVTSQEVSPIEQFALGLFPDKKFLTEELATIKTPNHQFNGTIQIQNSSNRKKEYALIAIWDDKQIPFVVNNFKNKVHRITIEPNKIAKVNVIFSDLSQGVHDLILFYVADPDKLNTKDEFEPPPNFFGWCRARVYVIDDNSSGFRLNIAVEGNPNKVFKLSGIVLSKYPDKPEKAEGLPLYIYENISSNKRLHFYTHLGNSKEKDLNMTLIPFLNLQQTEIKTKDGIVVDHINSTLKGKEQAIIETELNPKISRSTNFFIIQIRNPQSSFNNYKNDPFDMSIRMSQTLSLIK